jgi:hypothetical protein
MRLQLQIPDTLNISEFDIKMFIAAKLYEGGKLPLGYAADVAGISKRAFIRVEGLIPRPLERLKGIKPEYKYLSRNNHTPSALRRGMVD